MLDPRLFRTELDFVKAQLSRRLFEFDPAPYIELEARRKEVQVKAQELQNERNSRSKLVGQAKAKGEDVQPILKQMQHLGDDLKAAEAELAEIQQEMSGTDGKSSPTSWMNPSPTAKTKKPMLKSAVGATCLNSRLRPKTTLI